MNEITLAGCHSSPLASYLKALAVLRLVQEQQDDDVRGFWRGHAFVLVTVLSERDLRDFFLEKYAPTPIISPWNGRSGFLEGEHGEGSTRKGPLIVRKVESSKGRRLEPYRSVLGSIRKISIIQELDQTRAELKRLAKAATNAVPAKNLKREEKRLKNQLLVFLRNELEDRYLPWLDACMALVGGEQMAAPLLGSGGNEGSLDFSINHLESLSALFDRDSDRPTELARPALEHALFDSLQPLKAFANPGFMNPMRVGGVNMGTGFSEVAGENPWNAVLMLEGAVLFASAATKRLSSGGAAGASFPFMVEAVCAGHGSIAARESARPEFWAPLWTRPASAHEVRRLLAEGRSTIGRRQARDGLDMARSVATLGVNRGLSGFQRFGLFERRGQGSYVATSLGSFSVKGNPQKDWIAELERGEWMQRLRSYARTKTTPERFVTLARRLEEQLFRIAGQMPTAVETQQLLTLVGQIHSAVAVSTAAQAVIPPVPQLSEDWVSAADDSTSAFRIACAVAGLHAPDESPFPLRAQIFPIHPISNRWIADVRKTSAHVQDPTLRLRFHIPSKGNLTDVFIRLLTRRLWVAEQLQLSDVPLRSWSGAGLDDVGTFLRDDGVDSKIAALLPGLSLCKIPLDRTQRPVGSLPAAFALLKLCVTPNAILHELCLLRNERSLSPPPGLIQQLAAGNAQNRAVRTAWRKLIASEFPLAIAPNALPELVDIDPRRAAAALLIPLCIGALRAMSRAVITGEPASKDVSRSTPSSPQESGEFV